VTKRGEPPVVRGKRSLPPEPREGDPVHMKEPTKAELARLRHLVSGRCGKRLPITLQNKLEFVLLWAGWQIGRPWTRERIRYQRWRAVREGVKRGLTLDEACTYAVEKLADEPSRGRFGAMKRDYMIEQGMTGLPRRSRRP
jgi:hypothetical protein